MIDAGVPPRYGAPMPLSRHGIWEMFIGSVVLLAIAAGLALVWWPLAWLVLPVLVWLFAFFRDPDRAVPEDPRAYVSPADGTVTDVQPIEYDELLQGPAVRVGIFLSVFNVHVNRSPCDGRVLKLIYKKGRFANALKHDVASAENESNTIVIGDESGRPIAVVRQIVGLIARRIICEPQVGQTVARGQRIGLIKFGSRTELTLPVWLDPQPQVKVGDKVRGASDVIFRVAPPVVSRPESASESRRLSPAG